MNCDLIMKCHVDNGHVLKQVLTNASSSRVSKKYRVIHLSPRILNFNNFFQTKPICLKISRVLVNTLRIFS